MATNELFVPAPTPSSKSQILGRSLAVVLLSLLTAGPADAQLENLTGARVRLTIGPPGAHVTKVKGVLIGVSPDSVTLANDDVMRSVLRTHIRQVDISAGRRRMTLRGAVTGAGIGALTFGVIAATTNDPNYCEKQQDGWFCIDYTTPQVFLMGSLAGGLLGLLVGGIVGFVTTTDRWARLDAQVATLPTMPREGMAPAGVRLVVRL